MDIQDNELQGTVALITGAASGIGRADAVLMATRGATIIVQDIDAAGLSETVELVRSAGGSVFEFAFDLTDFDQLRSMVETVELQTAGINVVVNNAGVGSIAPLETIDVETFDRVFAVHVGAAFQLVKAVVPGMKRRKWGKIINMSSRWALVGHEFASDYCAAKAALMGFTKAWAKEMASWNIQVNAVAPGGVWTAMAIAEKGGAEGIRQAEMSVPLQRWAQPEELANLVAFLASSRSDFITGQVLSANGGATIVGI